MLLLLLLLLLILILLMLLILQLLQVALKNDPWVEYNAACFVTKFLSFFLTLDKYHVLRWDHFPENMLTNTLVARGMDTTHRKELWLRQLPVEAVSMVAHPRLPAAIIGTMDGRLLLLAIEVPLHSLDLEDEEDLAKAKVNLKFIGSIFLHSNPIDQIQVDPKTLNCVAVSNEEGTVAVVDFRELGNLRYVTEATVEGRVLDSHLQGKQLLVLTTSGGEQETYGDLITLLKLDPKKRSLAVLSVFNLATPSSGLALSETGKSFFSLQYTTKHLAKFSLSEEEVTAPVAPLASVSSGHGLGLHMIQVTPAGDLALLGRDGRLTIHRPDLSGLPEAFELQHYQAGGVIDAGLSASGHILSVGGEGSLVLFLRQEPLETSQDTTDKAAVAALQKLPEVEVHPAPVEESWSQRRALEQKESERKKYEQEINTITETVEGMAAQVAQLLQDNNSLPESDRLDRRQFELDVEEQARQVAEGGDKVADLKMDLRAWTLARQQVSMRVKKEVWDSMEVPGRSLEGIRGSTVVNNFPLLSASEEQERKLKDVREERRLEMTLAKDTAELRGQGSSANSARSSVNPCSPRPGSPGPAVGGEEGEQEGQGEEARWELLGSRSYLYVDIDSCLLIPQLEITTQKQSQQQIILLRDVVRQLKKYFNAKFDSLFQEKEEAFERITATNERLDSVLAELRLEEEIIRPRWNADEKPEMDLPEEAKEVTSVRVEGSLTSGRTSAGGVVEGSKDVMKKRGVMMGMESGTGKNTIPPPLFMKIKKPENFTDEEVAAAESYYAEVQRMAEKGHFRKRELEAEMNLLQVQIDEIVEAIDKKVKDLFWLRISVEKCVLSEELKMLTLNRDLGVRDRLTRQEELLNTRVQETEAEHVRTRESLEMGRTLLEGMKAEHKEKVELDKLMDKNFKKEFPGLGFHQVDSLYKLFKKRPKAAERVEKVPEVWGQAKAQDSR